MDTSCPKTVEWAEIPGYTGFLASTDGQIKRAGASKVKSQRRAANGAWLVEIGRSSRMVHDLIARAFYGHPTCKGYRVRHLNGDLSDNCLENLVWTGAPKYSQGGDVNMQLEREYNRLRLERLSLVELMS